MEGVPGRRTHLRRADPTGLQEADRLPSPIFTPTTKAPVGTHDEAMTFDDVVAAIGGEQAEAVRALALAVYRQGAAHAERQGIILADTKFELGWVDGELVLADEVLTPDSSRFWPADAVAAGHDAPVVRQAAGARRAGGVGLGQDPAAARPVGRYRRRHPRSATSRPTSGCRGAASPTGPDQEVRDE